MKNNVQLITYIDRLAGSNIEQMSSLLETKLPDLFSGIHLLPFFYPIDGSDAGFDPIDHTEVDERLGTWQDIAQLGDSYELMADLIVNHMSAQSKEFKDVLAKGEQSPYWDLFITKDKIFPSGLTEQDADKIYRPRPGSCFTPYQLESGDTVDFWTTFTSNQIDIDVNSHAGKQYLNGILKRFADNNIKIIRLDAAGYAIKKAGTSCFMLDQTFDFINQLSEQANQLGINTLVEIHSYYQTQIEIAQRVDLVYDFALPPLVLHTLFSRDASALVNWLTISPKNCITVLDTHDGIGIIDVGPMDGKPGLLDEQQIDVLVETIHKNSHGESLQATGNAASNVDLYQVNCSYYAALGHNDKQYLLARAIQFFAPGVPQVYYGGLLAQANDMTLLSQTNVGRDINRPYLNKESVETDKQRAVVKALSRLIEVRNSNTAFDGEFSISQTNQQLTMVWRNQDKASSAMLRADLTDFTATITTLERDTEQQITLAELYDSFI